MSDIKCMGHIVKGYAMVLLADCNEELLEINWIYFEFFNELKKLKHAIPTTKKSASTVLKIAHVYS